MSISGLQSVANNYQQSYVQNAASKAAETAEPAKKVEKAEAAAVYEKSPKVESGDYSEKVSRMLAESQRKVAEFQNMFARYLGGQASMYGISTWSKDRMTAAFAKATPEEVSAAKAAIAEGGYYSVNAVSDRIMNMAMALSGGDSSKIDTLRSAVQKGFEQAGMTFGSELPQICQDTYSEIMDRFDAWELSSTTESEIIDQAQDQQ